MEELFKRPILIWSEYCNHSKNFINTLIKHNELFESFVRINIDVDPQTHKRPALFYQIQSALNFKIAQVPTIIVNNGEYILPGVEAFKWLDYTINKQQVVKEELQGFNPNEMGSFSDAYAKYGSTKLHDATDQSFKFIDKQDQKIETPQEEGVLTQDEMMKKQRERESIDFKQLNNGVSGNNRPQFNENFTNINANKKEINLSQYSNTRNDASFMPRVSKSRIDFTNDNFGFAGELNSNVNSNVNGNVIGGSGGGTGASLSRSEIKQREIDQRLQQLMADRETTLPQAPRYR